MFIYSEKATKVSEISTLLLSYVVPVKSKVEISQNFVAFSEKLNFNYHQCDHHINTFKQCPSADTLHFSNVQFLP